MARPDFRSQAAQRLASERQGYTPALIDLLRPEDPSTVRDVRQMPVERVYSNPDQPRQHFDEEALHDLAASIREHGVLQPVLVRPRADGHYQIVAGERRWRAAKIAGLTDVPVIVEQFDDETALEIAIIENLQREDITPLEEAEMFRRMTHEHGYSLRKLATKLGKDKGYLENRLRLVDAPEDVRQLVAQRSDTLSAAYELMKVQDARKRRRLARQVASGELSLVKLRQRIEGKTPAADAESIDSAAIVDAAFAEELADSLDQLMAAAEAEPEAGLGEATPGLAETLAEPTITEPLDAVGQAAYVVVPIEPDGPAIGGAGLDVASEHLSTAVAELADALRTDPALALASSYERQRFAKFLTLAKIQLENAIAVVRADEHRGLSHSLVRQLESAMAAAEERQPTEARE